MQVSLKLPCLAVNVILFNTPSFVQHVTDFKLSTVSDNRITMSNSKLLLAPIVPQELSKVARGVWLAKNDVRLEIGSNVQVIVVRLAQFLSCIPAYGGCLFRLLQMLLHLGVWTSCFWHYRSLVGLPVQRTVGVWLVWENSATQSPVEAMNSLWPLGRGQMLNIWSAFLYKRIACLVLLGVFTVKV